MGDTQIRIAIIGGGMAGATLANALVRIPHINVQVFEAAPEFSERGAALGLSKNAQDALQEILPAPKDTLQKAGGVPMASTRLMMGSGPAAGNLLFDFADAKGADEIIVHRASLLRELLEPLPKEILHANKKLAAIDSSGDSVKITFADETVHEFDAVIGADGIFSSVRDHIMSNLDGNEQETFSATAAGFWDTRVLVPMEKAKEKLGAELFKVDRQYGWLGDNAFIMHDIVEDGTVVHCVISGVEQETPKDRKTTLTKEGLTRTLKSWLGERIADGIIELVLDQENPTGYSQFEHKTTPTYARGPVCIIGDAAHATTPWQGAGAGQAFEDVMVLSALLREVSAPAHLEAAFKAYDAVRRPRGQQVIDSSRGTGLIFCGQSEARLEPDKVMQALAPRWDFLNIEPKAHIEEALAKLREMRASA